MTDNFNWQPVCIDINGKDVFYCPTHGALRIEEQYGIKIYLRDEQVSKESSPGSARAAERNNT